MVEQSHRFISEQLEKMPEHDPDRDFLKGIGTRLGNRLRRKEEAEQSGIDEENLTVAEAQARLQGMIEKDNASKLPLYGEAIDNITKLQESSPENSVARLLPAEWQGFKRTIYLLNRAGIDTKEKLIDTPIALITRKKSTNNIQKIRHLGSKTIPFVLAMRDLAIAEARERSSQIN